MAFDPNEHYLDADGFQRHKETHHYIGIQGAPPPENPDAGGEYPKWVVPHQNHVHQRGEHISTPHFPEHYVNRANGEVLVLAHTEEDGKRAAADPNAVELLGQ